ncbi:MAG: ATP-dependent Clp protease proteolytic subunit, partial [uncultured Thermomicrobiales bacterium]
GRAGKDDGHGGAVHSHERFSGPLRDRDDQPGRAHVRRLLAAAEGSHHLPRHRDRRPDRQRDCRPADLPGGRGPHQGNQPLHQQPRRRGLRRHGDLRHDAVHQGPGRDLLRRHGRLDGGDAPDGGHAGQALRPAPLAYSHPSRVRGLPGDDAGRGDPGTRDDADNGDATRDHGATLRPGLRHDQAGHRARLLHECRRGPRVRHHRRSRAPGRDAGDVRL